MMSALELKNITKVYGEKVKTKVLNNTDLTINEGEFVSIIGQSGSGKSTLLNIMGTLSKGSSGTLYINGINVEGMNKNELADLRNSKLGFIFQFHYLLPEFTVLENILMPYSISGKKVNKEILERANELIDLVGLTKVKNNMATDLSGGQQQRAAIARALINSPKIILADEPTGNLDSNTTNEIYNLLRDINKKYNTTFVIITHDNRIAEKADRVIEVLDGNIIKDYLN
ncbi:MULTISPECIES: ABC transporter ATP-binding protein [Clostridium]|uniref:ABC transporter ATP-binding protein n=1 Tax=Clostridium TaxID=1485 RepID=UPI000C074F13|nr:MULTISPECIES: ABC transporter ATP-binding protein [Clostridium]MBS7131756.1 ABC transporter ATP-binding protein [Clostridium sp.]MDB2075905.1 ABC transporter ATP-binding protein [Clostridium paraputrificum]MDB2080437.1 ABC transporter ATP-binding protein [Clostridium paraputrificum]MDB2086114.1 ABC transporter ATP-binding protein [Clostridium paraputrificum]MDB2091332.1 ABC transporter ATP-binding protein [Clostridium paraputrificum]